jgi:ADP-dependent NAD(P)H-hydrate dehydratase / NAD(P)H-hydrate epimerase
MKIFSAEQTRQWDQYTIGHEPISSIQLMERAATQCADWILQRFNAFTEFVVFCGKGNNGGDGLAITRMLLARNRRAQVYILENKVEGTKDFHDNFQRLKSVKKDLHEIRKTADFPIIEKNQVIIDALFGSGLNRPLEDIAALLVQYINEAKETILSIDLPSGLFADKNSSQFPVIRASYTLSFQSQKLAFLLAENAAFTGETVLLDIGLHPDFEQNTSSRFTLLGKNDIGPIFEPRKKFTHKGSYGHAAIFSGSFGMMGAAVLAAKAGLRSGTGKITAVIPGCGVDIIQIAVPEAICIPDEEKNHLKSISDTERFDAVGIGPGIGMHPDTIQLFENIISSINKPLVVDADGLNIISSKPGLLERLPAGTILTPHPKEFERLFGDSKDDFERIELVLQKASQWSIYIILKGYHSFIGCPDGKGFFNSSGNPGMATAGSGDVLTGMLAGLLAQGYTALDACKAGVFLHGLAGDIASAEKSEPGLIAGDIIECIGKAYLEVKL